MAPSRDDMGPEWLPAAPAHAHSELGPLLFGTGVFGTLCFPSQQGFGRFLGFGKITSCPRLWGEVCARLLSEEPVTGLMWSPWAAAQEAAKHICKRCGYLKGSVQATTTSPCPLHGEKSPHTCPAVSRGQGVGRRLGQWGKQRLLCQSPVFPELHTPVQSAVKTRVLLFPGPWTDTGLQLCPGILTYLIGGRPQVC